LYHQRFRQNRLLTILTVFFLFALQIGGLFSPKVSFAEDSLTTRVNQSITTTGDYFYKYGQSNSDWDTLALYLANKPVSTHYLDYVKSQVSNLTSTTDMARTIIGWTAAGQDATDINGTKLVHNLVNQINEKLNDQKINDLTWSLIALDSKPSVAQAVYSGTVDQTVYNSTNTNSTVTSYIYTPGYSDTPTRDVLINQILQLSLPNGGWTFNTDNFDPDMTGMVLSALAPYYNDSYPDVKAKVNLAVPLLEQSRPTNSISIAQIILGLTAVGDNSSALSDQVNNLLSYAQNNGEFKYELSNSSGLVSATQQAFYALNAYKNLIEQRNNGLVYQNMSNPLAPEQRPDHPPLEAALSGLGNVSVRIEGPKGTIATGHVTASQALDAVQQVLDSQNIIYHVSGSTGSKYVDSIADIKSATYGGWDGWMDSVIRNGKWVDPGYSSIDMFPVQPSDEVVVYYADFGAPNVDSITVTPGNPDPNQPFTVTVQQDRPVYDQYYNRTVVTEPAKAVQVDIGNQIVTTDDQGQAKFTGLANGLYTLAVTGYQKNAAPKIIRAVQNLQVGTVSSGGGAANTSPISISVTGYNGQTTLPSQSLSFVTGDTPYTVLTRALGSSSVQSTGSGSSLYVTAINGLGQFDHGPKSGWMCSVNGQYLSESAGSYRLQAGDIVAWKYTTDLGVDLGVPSNDNANQADTTSQAVVDSIKTVDLSYDNTKPINQVSKTVAILNSDEKMSEQAAQQLADTLRANQVNLSQAVDPTKDQVLADPIQEVTLALPAQALSAPKTIQIQKLANTNSSSQSELLSPVYNFLPNGTHFDKPVDISIKVPLTVSDLSQLALCWLNEDTNQWIPIPAAIDAKTGIITGQVNHFTKFAVIDKSQLAKADTVDVTSAIDTASNQLLSTSDLSDWSAFALARAGKSLPASYLASVAQQLKEHQGSFRNITDYQRMALGVLAAGGDPTNIAGYNLVEKIYDNDRMTLQGTNGVIFALVALDSGNYPTPSNAKWNRDKLIDWLLAQQNTDGGWPLVTGDPSLVDLTSMALVALAPYQDQANVKKAADQAVAWLSSHQNENGSFTENGEINSESVAQAITGLTALGIDPTEARFTKTNGNLVTSLLGFQQKDGGFAHQAGLTSNAIATEQDLIALDAYQNFAQGEGSIYQFVSKNKNEYLDQSLISPWAIDAVGKARSYKLMQGVSKTAALFAPKQALTRAEFTTLLLNLLGEKPVTNSNDGQIFRDVPVDSWYDGYVMKAKELGIVKGISNTSFGPDLPINREQMAIMLTKSLKLTADSNGSAPSDLSLASPASISSIQAVYANGLMIGDHGHFDPKGKVSREMAAVVAVHIYEQKLQAAK
jgi:hypothetical protein